MSNAARLLRAARAIIEDPEHWTKRYYARDAQDRSARVEDDDACKFCSLGAVHKAFLNDQTFKLTDTYYAKDFLGKVTRHLTPNLGIGGYNDTHNHEQVLEMFDQAIKLADEWVEDFDA